MKILLLVIGKTDEKYLVEGMEKYRKRLKYYIGFDYEEIPDIKNRKSLSEFEQKKLEGALILSKLKAGDKLVLLDDKGNDYHSIGFAKYLQQQMNSGIKRLVFVVGGPYGLDELVLKNGKTLNTVSYTHLTLKTKSKV